MRLHKCKYNNMEKQSTETKLLSNYYYSSRAAYNKVISLFMLLYQFQHTNGFSQLHTHNHKIIKCPNTSCCGNVTFCHVSWHIFRFSQVQQPVNMHVQGHKQGYAAHTSFNISFGWSNIVFFMFSGEYFIAEGQMSYVLPLCLTNCLPTKVI